MAVGLRVLALAVEAKVLCQRVQEGTLVGGHGLEAEAFLVGVGGEYAELALLRLRPNRVFAVELEGRVREGDMVVCMVRVDVERVSEAPVALQTETLVVAFQCIARGRWVGPGSLTADLLLAVLAGAGDEGLALARLVLAARVRCVARVGAGVVAGLADLAARLGAVRTCDADVLALARPVAEFAALVGAALEFLAARESAGCAVEPTGLVLERFLSTDAGLFDEEGTFGARDIVRVALVGNSWVTAELRSGAVEAAFGRPCPARLGRLEDCSSAGAANLVEDGF